MIDIEKALPQLESVRQQHLESDMVTLLAQRLNVNPSLALGLYYKSDLSRQIACNAFGIRYLDAEVLVEDLLDNESNLFVSCQQ